MLATDRRNRRDPHVDLVLADGAAEMTALRMPHVAPQAATVA
jgi:hypothetical protein